MARVAFLQKLTEQELDQIDVNPGPRFLFVGQMTGHFGGRRGSITPKKSGAIETEKRFIRVLPTTSDRMRNFVKPVLLPAQRLITPLTVC
jgi:hypothetical protein